MQPHSNIYAELSYFYFFFVCELFRLLLQQSHTWRNINFPCSTCCESEKLQVVRKICKKFIHMNNCTCLWMPERNRYSQFSRRAQLSTSLSPTPTWSCNVRKILWIIDHVWRMKKKKKKVQRVARESEQSVRKWEIIWNRIIIAFCLPLSLTLRTLESFWIFDEGWSITLK